MQIYCDSTNPNLNGGVSDLWTTSSNIIAMASIDEYDFGQSLGRGAFANVYRARNRKTGQVVAIKICERPQNEDQNWVMRMKNEISIHSKLKHPNIVSLYNCFECEMRVYLVLELCEGGNLYQCLRDGPLDETLAVSIIQQLASALEHIQSKGVLHRDLKLSNILLTGDLHDPNSVVKLCDFGLACRKEHPDEEHFTFCGTPNYIAPEIISNNAHDLPADLWSLGCLFYTMVVGFPPFDRDVKEDIFQQIQTGIYEEPVGLMSESGLQLLRSLLELNPLKRASIKEILAHSLLSPITSAASSPNPERYNNHHSRNHNSNPNRRHPHNREQSYEFSSHFVSVGRRSNPTQAGWDEVGSSNTADRNRGNIQHAGLPFSQPHGAQRQPNLVQATANGRVVTAASAILQSEEESYRLVDQRVPRPEPLPPPQQLPQSLQRQKPASPPNQADAASRNVPDYYRAPPMPADYSVSHEISLQEQEVALRQKLHSLQAELQRTRHAQRAAERDGSSTTTSTAVVSYPHNNNTTRGTTSVLSNRSVRVAQHVVSAHSTQAGAVNQAHLSFSPAASPTASPTPSAVHPQHSAYFPTPGLLQRPTVSDSEPTQLFASTPKKASPAQPVVAHGAADYSGRATGHAIQSPSPATQPQMFSRSVAQVTPPKEPRPHHTADTSNASYPHTTGYANNMPSSPIGAASPNTTTNLSTSFLHGLSYSLDLNNTSTRSDSFLRNSRSWLDSISEIRSSVSGISTGECKSNYGASAGMAVVDGRTAGADGFGVPGAVHSSQMHLRGSEIQSPQKAAHGHEQAQRLTQSHTHGAPSAYRETEWMRQYAYEKHINGARGLSVYNCHSPNSISHPLSASNVSTEPYVTSPIPSVEPTFLECLDSVFRDMNTLKPFCFSSSKDEMLLLSTERELVLVLQVRKQLPDREPETQHFRLLLSLADRSNVVLGRLNAGMVEEVEKIGVEVLTSSQKGAKNHVFNELAEKSENYKAQDALKFHNCYSASELHVFRYRAGAKAIPIDPLNSSNSGENTQSSVPKLVHMMLQRVHQLLLSAKCRMPKQVSYFTIPMTPVNAPHDSSTATVANCKCMLMHNDPFPDFIVHWQDGARLKYELKTGRLQIVKPPSALPEQNPSKALKWSGFISLPGADSAESVSSAQNSNNSTISTILPTLVPYVSIAQRALAKCLTEWGTADKSGLPKVYTLE